MSRRASPLVILCALAALAGCGSGGGDDAKTTTTTTTAAAADASKLTAAQSRRAAGEALDRWSDQILKSVNTLRVREQAGVKGLRDAYFKADGVLRAQLAELLEFPAQAQREGARYVPASLVGAFKADAEAWKQWADGTADIRAAAERGQYPDNLARAALTAHLAAYKAAKREPPAAFRRAVKVLASSR